MEMITYCQKWYHERCLPFKTIFTPQIQEQLTLYSPKSWGGGGGGGGKQNRSSGVKGLLHVFKIAADLDELSKIWDHSLLKCYY